MTNTTMSGVKPTFNSFMDYTKLDRNRQRTVVFYGRVSTEHEAQLSALENQMQWYSDQAKYHPNWNVIDKYIDEGITGTQAKKRPSFLRMIEDAKSGKFDLIVTREVCRFARNTVDTLNFTRELKNIGVEVYFVEDNIWTMDGDGELRLSLMATLAQEESRKVSERVKAGQKISRENKTLYGSGNILGYDRKPGETYTINPEQAETVKMIFELYAKGMGSSKICKMLTEAKRKNASGKVKWECSSVLHIIKNATYMGYICYNKSRSNNYLEQKRINNLDETTYELVNGLEFDVKGMIDDLINAVCVLCKDGLVYRFTHRSFQEYFTALFLKELSDDNLKKIGLGLIRQDPLRSANDSTFHMLFDMARERMEQSILLPLLISLEEECTINKYDFYLLEIDPQFEFDFFRDGDSPQLGMLTNSGSTLTCFVREFDRYYSTPVPTKDSDDRLLNYLIENLDYEIGHSIKAIDILENPEIYNLFKETWIGKTIERISKMKEVLIDKKRETALGLDALLMV